MRSLWRPVLDRVTPYEAGPPLEALAAELGVELVRLSANESPLGPSPRVVEAVRREAARVHLYPDGGCRALREALGRRLGVAPGQVAAAVELLSEGATVPFIARYRKEKTGGLDDTQLRKLEERLGYLRELEDRRASVLKTIEDQGKLTAELARAYGFGGRPRRSGSVSERARVAVTRSIKYAIDKIAEHDPTLADHLRRAVRTGTFCVYTPPARDRVSWRF